MLANKDKGTSVGFSSDFILSGHEFLPQGITTNSTEVHELWVEYNKEFKKWLDDNNFKFILGVSYSGWLKNGEQFNVDTKVLVEMFEKSKTMNKECEHEWLMEIPSGVVYCKNCKIRNLKADFKPEKQINRINKGICTEHEWIGFTSAYTGNDTEIGICCKNCGMMQPKDFKVKDNLEVIEDNNWDEIENKLAELTGYNSSNFLTWLKENYFAPEKK